MTENIKIFISEVHDVELKNQRFDYSSPVNDDDDELRAPFMSPKPSSPKNNKKINYIPSILGKRKFVESFDIETFDDERYGQHIGSAFFVNSVGHNVHYGPVQSRARNGLRNT
jgi:hypothetical protein